MLLLAAAAISGGVVAAKQAYAEGAAPIGLVAIRLVVAAPLLTLVIPGAVRRRTRPLSAGPLLVASAAGAIVWVAYRAELEGLARLPAGVLVLLLVTTPVWVATFTWIGSRRLPTGRGRLAILAVILGVAIMVGPLQNSPSVGGVAAGLLSAVSFALFVVVLEQNRSVPPELGLPLGIIGASACLLLTTPEALVPILRDRDLLVLGAVVGVSAAAWAALFAVGLRETSAVTAATVTAIEPVFVAMLAFLVLGERLGPRELIGGLVVLAGTWTAATSPGLSRRRCVDE